MCFSAAASFGASAVLTGIGIASIKEVKDSSQYPFASIPLIFGVQQLMEGFVWVSATHDAWAGFQAPASYGFLGIAQIIWPLLFPIAFSLVEKDMGRKRLMKLLQIPGIIIAAYFLYVMVFFNLDTWIINHHVFYDIDFPRKLIPYAAGFYLAASIAPPLLSKDFRIKLIGVILLAGYLITRIFFQPSLISVWCFFGIACSIVVYIILRHQKLKIAA